MHEAIRWLSRPLGGALLLLSLPLLAAQQEPTVMGWAERAVVYPVGIEFRAKLDSGARTSSINAADIREFRRNGAPWVRFTIDNGSGATADIELPVQRVVRIREHGGTFQRRPVVNMGICVGAYYKEAEVNLVNRGGFVYPLLIGRTYLRSDILIDSGRTKTVAPECPGIMLPEEDQDGMEERREDEV